MSCEKNIQELYDSIKRPNWKIMDIEEEETGLRGKFTAMDAYIKNTERSQINDQMQRTSETKS
jgi:hypothetical protein